MNTQTYINTYRTYFPTGMSSGVAMGKHVGGVAEYRSSEGKAVTLPYRGYIKSTINDILGGIRSSCTYVGARCVSTFEYPSYVRVQLFLSLFSRHILQKKGQATVNRSCFCKLLFVSKLFFHNNGFKFSQK